MLILKRKQIIAGCLALLVAMAGYLNWSYRAESKETAADETIGEIHLVSDDVQPEDFFEAARLEREDSRAEATETLKSMMDSDTAEASSKIIAEEKVMKMAELTEKETTVENLIKAKGYTDAVVYLNDEKANVVVRADEFSNQDATIISEIITEQTGISAANIKITQVK
ncbi:MAG: SpoIIIAH-like family protein [Clostridia bacterium]|nr:SpoIIIAH-like family protein [Clostridia bacterium]